MSDSRIPGAYYGTDGPFVYAACPKCRRFMRLPKRLKISEARGVVSRVRCSRCGLVTPNHEYV